MVERRQGNAAGLTGLRVTKRLGMQIAAWQSRAEHSRALQYQFQTDGYMDVRGTGGMVSIAVCATVSPVSAVSHAPQRLSVDLNATKEVRNMKSE